MSKQQVSFLQVTDATTWKGLTQANQLGALWSQDPQKISNKILEIQALNFGNNIDSILAKYDVKMLEDERDFVWELRGKAPKNTRLIEARVDGTAIDSTSIVEAGKYGAKVELIFEQDLFTKGDIIAGNNPDLFQMRIVEYTMEGTGYARAVCTVWGKDEEYFVPIEDLLPNTYWSFEYHPVEEAFSKDGSEVHYGTNISLRNGFTHVRMKQENAGNMIGKKIAGFVLPTETNGKQDFLWTDYQTFLFDYEHRMQWNRMLMFGRTNKTKFNTFRDTGLSGFSIKAGAGLRQQGEVSHFNYYTVFTINKLDNILADISEARLAFANRVFTARTGERGSIQFHEALENHTYLYTLNQTDKRFYDKSAEFASMGLGYGGQFVEYKGPNNKVFNFSVDSMYDDRDRNKKAGPNGGVEESYRYDIDDMGTTHGEPNVQLYKAKNMPDRYTYINGMRDPYTFSNGEYGMATQAVSPTDGWEEHKMSAGAAVRKDPTTGASLVYGTYY